MASPEFWERIPELSAIAVIAADVGSPLRMRGSTARALRQLAKDGRPIDSLFDSVPPLADIDLVAPSRPSARELHDRILREFGESRFFHTEIKTEADVARYEGLANVQISGEPEILFSSGEQDSDVDERAFLHVNYDPDKRKVRFYDQGSGPPEGISLISKKELRLPQFALADLLYLVRRFPNSPEDPAIRTLAEHLKSVGGASVAKSLRGATNRRAVFCFLKYLVDHFLFRSNETTQVLHRILGLDFLKAFAEARADGDPLRAMVNLDLARPKARQGLMCTVVPRLESSGRTRKWIRHVESVSIFDADSPTTTRLLEFEPMTVQIDSDLNGISVIGPPAHLEVDDPPDPGCCRFKDFDRGVAEIVWVDPSSHRVHPRLGVVAEGEGQDERVQFFTYCLNSGSHVASLRCDYNFLCIGAGSRRFLNVYRIAKQDAN